MMQTNMLKDTTWLRVTLLIVTFAVLTAMLWFIAPPKSDAATAPAATASCSPSWPSSPSESCSQNPTTSDHVETGQGPSGTAIRCPLAAAGAGIITYAARGSGVKEAAALAAWGCSVGYLG